MISNTEKSSAFFVLASLGVYLGLVLAGAAPQARAQETRNDGARIGMEQQRDLGKRPDGEKALEQFAAALEEAEI